MHNIVARLHNAKVPFFYLGIALSAEALSLVGVLPSQGTVLKALGQWLAASGLWAVLGISVAENVIGINTYFPGSVAILLSMASTSNRPDLAIRVWSVITAGALVGQVASFLIGRTVVRFREEARGSPPGLKVFMLTFWHPQFAAITSATSGASNAGVWLFVSRCVPCLVCWNLFWGAAMYFGGNFVDLSQEGSGVIIICLLLWAIYRIWSSPNTIRPV